MGYIYTKSGKLAKRLYFGAVLLFEGLYYTFKNRVLADGGTFLENELTTISQDASLVLTPNAYKVGKLYSAVPNDGTGDFTVDRNSTATYIDEDGIIRTALANVPRIDYSTGEAALLVEPQRTNLITYSEAFDNASWNRSGINITANTDVSPTGLINADLSTAESGDYYIMTTSITLDVGMYNISVYAKGVGASIGKKITILPWETGTALLTGGFFNFFLLTDYWQRFNVTFTVTTSGTMRIRIDPTRTTTGSTVEVGDEVLIWGAQLEQASTASSYIPTNGTTVTRLADDISVPTPAGVTAITETIEGVDQIPITTIPATYSLPVGNINKVRML